MIRFIHLMYPTSELLLTPEKLAIAKAIERKGEQNEITFCVRGIPAVMS